MSTVLSLLQHEAPFGRLCRFKPLLRGRQTVRRILSVERAMHDWLYDNNDSAEMTEVKAQARAHFNRYARGQTIDDLHFMKRVEDRRVGRDPFSHGVWAMGTRFDPPPPQFRYFGTFALTDVFVVLTKQSREFLDGSDDRWHAEIDKTVALWDELFPGEMRWVPSHLDEYISSNVEKRDDRW